jgi:hypothetical protein
MSCLYPSLATDLNKLHCLRIGANISRVTDANIVASMPKRADAATRYAHATV